MGIGSINVDRLGDANVQRTLLLRKDELEAETTFHDGVHVGDIGRDFGYRAERGEVRQMSERSVSNTKVSEMLFLGKTSRERNTYKARNREVRYVHRHH